MRKWFFKKWKFFFQKYRPANNCLDNYLVCHHGVMPRLLLATLTTSFSSFRFRKKGPNPHFRPELRNVSKLKISISWIRIKSRFTCVQSKSFRISVQWGTDKGYEKRSLSNYLFNSTSFDASRAQSHILHQKTKRKEV